MSTELTLLVWSAVLCVALALPYTMGVTIEYGLGAAAGNREDLPELTGWIGRARRAHANMVENLIPFAAIVLAAQIAGKNGALTVLGAQLFFWFRVAHAIIYIAGIPYLRTLAWVGSVVGMALIVTAFFA
jgi:uncharacterized MAPEG superfamily protein